MSTEYKKMKLNKKFQPCKTNPDEDEIFLNGIFHFNITKMTEFIQDHPEKFPIEEIVIKNHLSYSPDSLDQNTIETANVANPIILGEISPGRFNVIDGNHRVERANRLGMEKIPAYRIFSKDHFVFLTSTAAYEAYVRYWNDKVKDLT